MEGMAGLLRGIVPATAYRVIKFAEKFIISNNNNIGSMPSAILQSRISTFESLGRSGASSSSSSTLPTVHSKSHLHPRTPFSPPTTPRPTSPSPSPPNLGHRTSLIDLKDWIVDDGPSSPPIIAPKPLAARTNGNGNSNGIWATNTGPLIAPLINLESPPKPKASLFSGMKAPPLPPRKPSLPSLKLSSSYSSSVSNNGKPTLRPPIRSDSLTVEHVHTYPPAKIDPSRPRYIPGHASASSISSFHSVSLSSDTDPSTPDSVSNFVATYPMDQDYDPEFSKSNSSEADSISLGESYEEVSISSLVSPTKEGMTNHDWEKASVGRVPPRLPQRPASSPSFTIKPPTPAPQKSASGSHRFRSPISSSSPSPAATTTFTKRRPPPPPPPTSRSSDRSSIRSNATSRSTSSTYSKIDHPWSISPLFAKTKRPTPVPPVARQRYERVFNANIAQQRKAEKQKAKEKPALLSPAEARGTRRAAGWRGLSVDLITGGHDVGVPEPQKEDEEEVNEVVGDSDRLEGCFIRSIWVRSKLDREKLCEIWWVQSLLC
jgi:hypothetical protein